MNTDGRTTYLRPKTTDFRPKTTDFRLKAAYLRGAGGTLARSVLTLLLLLAGGMVGGAWGQTYPTDVTGYETVTITIPASSYDASLGAPQMAQVKYNKRFPLVITSDDMGKTELTNNWAEVNGYPNINNTTDIGIQPGGAKFLAAPYKRYYMQGMSQNYNDYAPMTYTDNVGKTQRYRITSAIMPYLLNADGSCDYSHIDANDAKLMLRTGWSFAQHDVNDISSVANISTAMTANSSTWASKVGIGLKVMVEPNGNHDYLDAGKANIGICWNIFQNSDTGYPFQLKTLAAWAATRSDWTSSGVQSDATSFTPSTKLLGGYQRTFFQGHESDWETEVNGADGTSIVIGGTHGLGDEIKQHLRTATNVTNNAWVGSADEVWEYYHIYNNVVIENVSWDDTNKELSFDVKVPTYQKNQYRELTLNIPGLTGGSTPTFSGTSVITGGYNASGGSGIGYTMNIGLESSITTHINELMAIYRDDQTNLFVKRDIEYLISQLWDGSSYTTSLNASPVYDLTVGSLLGSTAGPTLATIKTDTNGEKSFAVPRYIVSGDKIYETTASGSGPKYAKTITTTSTPAAVSYTEKSLTSLEVDDYTPKAVLLVEGEDMTGVTILGADLDMAQSSSGRYYAMALGSCGMAGNLVSGTTATVTSALPRGKYKAVIGYGETYKSQGNYSYNLLVDGTQVATVSTSSATNNAVTELTTAEFSVTTNNLPITLTTDNTNAGSRWIDYIYFVQTGSLEPQVPLVSLTASAGITASIIKNNSITITATATQRGGSNYTGISIYQCSDNTGTIDGAALATSASQTTVTHTFTPSTAGTYYFKAVATDAIGNGTSDVITLTVVDAIDTYTLSIIDKSGNVAMTTTVASASLTADPLPNAYRSPFAENYKYYNTLAEAQANSGSNITTTAGFIQATIYVGYDVKSTFGADKAFAVWANSRYMHMVYRVNQAQGNDRYYLQNQKYDLTDIPSAASSTLTQYELTADNYALLDNHFMWCLGDDPYNVLFQNVANENYIKTQYNGAPSVQTDASNGDRFCIIYWQAKANNSAIDTSTDYCRLYNRTLSTNSTLADGDTGNRFLACSNDNNCEWRTIDRNHGSYDTFAKLYIKVLPEVTVNVLNSHGEVEAQLQAYNNPAATMQSFIPYSLLRAYTSSHALYYSYTDTENNSPVTMGTTALSTSTLESSGGNLYMTYSLDTGWRTVVKDAITYSVHSFDSTDDSDANWYGLRYNKTNTDASNYIKATAFATDPGTANLSDFTGSNADTDNGKQAQWALIGTPYHLEIANRYLGFDSRLGIPSSATTSSKAQVFAAGTSDVITTWEAVTWLNQGKSHLFFRPQGGFNGQAPYLYWSGPASLSVKASGGEMFDFYWAASTTQRISAPTVTLTASPASVYTGNTITLTATPSLHGNTSLSSILFQYKKDSGEWTDIATVTEGLVSGESKTQTFIPTIEGSYVFRATATDNGSLTGTSEETSAVTVTAAPALSTVTLSSSSSNPVAGTTVTLTATATPVSGYTVTRLVIEKKTGTDTWEEVGDAYTASAPSRGSAVRRASTVDPSTGEVTVTYDFTAGAVGTGYEFRANATFSDGNTPTTVLSTDAVASGGENQSLQLTSSLPESAPDNYTLHIIDNNGNDVFGGLSVTKQQIIDNNGEPLLAVYPQYCSPFVSQYLYFDTSDKAQANSGSATTWSNTDVYVGYTVDATKMAAGKVHAIWGNGQYMHIIYNAGNSRNAPKSALNWYSNAQYDVEGTNDTRIGYSTGPYVQHSNISASTLPFLDNSYMWDLGTDPYNIKLRNKAFNVYASSTAYDTRTLYDHSEVASAESYCLLYWQDNSSGGLGTVDTSAEYYRLLHRGNQTQIMQAWSNQWGASYDANNWNTRGKLYVKELPAINLNVLDGNKNVECTLQYYLKSDATMPSDGTDGGTSYYTPFNLYRSYTSKHKWWYNAAATDAVSSGSAPDATKIEDNGGNIYVTYTLDNVWASGTFSDSKQPFYLYPSGNGTVHWYVVKLSSNQYLTATTDAAQALPSCSISDSNFASYDANHKEYYWAFTGTPYNLKLINMYHGDGKYLGVPKASTAYLASTYLLDNTSENNIVWEMMDGLGKDNKYPFLRLQKSFNGETEAADCPLYLRRYWTGGNNPILDRTTDGDSQIMLTEITTTVITGAPTVTLTASPATTSKGTAVTLTATATKQSGNAITKVAIEQKKADGSTYTEVAYVTDGTATVTYTFPASDYGTFDFRAYAVVDNDETNLKGTTDADVTVTVAFPTPKNSTYTLELYDKSGNQVFSGISVTGTEVETALGDALPGKYRSPFVVRYKYYARQDAAVANSGTEFDWANSDAPTVYVGYEVDATKMAAAKEYAIASNVSKHYMHVNFRADQAHTDNAWWLQNQDLDVSNGSGSSVNIDNLPFVDDNYMWILGSDPYNVTLKNKKHGKYSQPVSTGATAGWDASAGTAIYSLVYWNGQTTGTDYALRWRDALPSASEYYVMSNTTYNDWRLTNTASADNAKLLIKELPDLNVKVVDASGTVEYTLHAHYLNTATMCQDLPYCLRRSYTTGHKFYYEQAGTNEITTGQLFDQTKFDGQNIYMKYSLESGWTEINQSNGWYALHFGKPTESKYLYVNDNKEVKGTSTSTQQSAHWHITGTPYAVKFMSRSNDGYYMGYTLASTSNDVVRVYNDNSALTTWELRTISQSGVDNSIKSCPVIHPQDAFSGEPPFLYLRYEGSKAFLGRDDNSCRVTFEDAVKVELVIVDKRGREVISEYTSIANITGTSGDPLSNTMRSPYAKNYHYYATLAEARYNSGTALDQTDLTAKGGSKVYVGYDIITQSNATGSDSIMKIDGSTPYRIRRNNNNTQGMHAVFAPSLTGSDLNNYGWKMDNQTKDDRDGSNTVNYNTLPFIDNTWAWELVSDNGDPYNVKFRNKATGQYTSCENNLNVGYRAGFTSDANAAAVYSLLRFGDSATGNYIAIYVDAPIGESRTQGYLYYNSSDGGTWRLQTTRSDARFRIEELTDALDIHIVAPTGTSHAGEVEATIHGYRNNGVGANTMPSFVPYFLTRAYTSGQKFYYTQAEAAAATSGMEITTVTDASITDSYGSDGVKDIFVSYTLDDTNWISSGTTLSAGDKTAGTTIIKPFYSSEKKINWYGIRTNENASNYLKATTTELPAVIGRTTIDTSKPDDADMKRSEWAIIGTPYSMQLVERQHGMASHLGVAADSARAYVYEGGTAGVVTTFELVTGLNSTTGKLFLRPQGSLNGQTPYVYIGGNADNMPLSRGAASAQIIDLTWITETDAKTVTFKLYDRDDNSMSSTVSDYTFYGVSEGDDLDDLFEAAGMKRRYCEYTFYDDAALTNVVTAVGTDDEEIIRAKWDYTDDAPVFNEGVLDVRDYQYYMIGVGSGSAYFLMDVEEDGGTYTFKPNDGVGTPRDLDHQFAIVGNPYSFNLYNRGAAKNIRRKASLDLTFEDTEEVEGVTTPTEVLEFDMPIVSTLTYSSTECSFRSKKSGRFLTATPSAFSMTQTSSPTQKTRFRYIIVPVRVFKEGATTWTSDAVNDQKDYRMYGLQMNPTVEGTVTARTTDERITTDYLRASDNAVGTARDYRHAFCDYTYYRSYDWDENLSNPIPTEGLSYYGGKGQYKKQFFATYTVDEQAFSRLYYMNANNNKSASSGDTSWQDAYIGKGSSSTNGYTLTGSREFENEVKKDENDTYRWFFTGDPYNMQIHCVGVGDLNSDYVLALKTPRTTNVAPTEDNGMAAVLTADLKENDSDTESYGQYSRFEIIKRSSGKYVLWSIDTGERYEYCLSNYQKMYNYPLYISTVGANENMNTKEWDLVDVFNHYTITWHVMENQGTTGAPSYADVASKDVVYDENTVLQVQDLPDELRRHFCLYSEMYSDNGCTDAIANNALTVTASTSIYVPYTLDSGAPDFLPEAPTAEPAEKYWYEIHYPGPEELVYYKTADGTVSHDLLNSSHTIDNVRNLGDSYTPYRWALIGTPYSVKFYNKQTSSYLNTDGSTLSMSASGTTFTLYDDYTGNLCAIYDAVTGKYLNATAGLQTYNGNEGTAVDFTNTYGVVKIAFVLHYSKNTLRQRDSNDDDVLDTTAANTTETIRIDSYQKMDKALDDVLPTVWKRAFCKYTYHWDTSTTEDTNTDTEVETVSESMVNAYNANKENYLYVHVTYDYEIDSPFKWSTADATWENKHWYYLVNNHIQGSERGKMVYRDSGPKLRVSTGLVDGRQYLYNFEWCVIGDPYGFKMLNHYDPDELFSQYISVTDVNDSANEGKQIEQQSGNTKCLFEMMPGRYSYNFWMHPIYDYTLMGNEYNNNTYTYVGHNYNGSAAIIPANRFNMTYLKSNTAANLRLEIRTDATLKEYLDYAGFVGSIKSSLVPEGLAEKITNGTATDEKLKALHDSIDNPTNLVQMQQGYYRIIPYVYEKGVAPSSEGSGRRYVRGYHYGSGTNGITNEGESTTSYSYHDRFEYESDNEHNQRLMANETPEKAAYDPASIFHFEATREDGHPRYLITTQGLKLSGHSLSTAEGFKTRYENIGAVTCQLKTVVGDPTNAANYLYLSWQQNAGGNEPDDYRRMELRNCFEMYGLTRLYLQPVGSGSAEMPLRLEMYPGQHTPEGSDTPLDYYFASIYVPYDVALPDGEVYAYAGKLTKNNGKDTEKDWRLQCEKLSEQTIGGVTYEKGKFIPAGTPALIRATATEVTANTDGLVTDYDNDHANTASGFITLTIPNNIKAGITPDASNIFNGQYLEQVLSGTKGTDVPADGQSVYVFGQATVNEDNGDERAYETIPDDENRTLEGGSHPKLEAGFYINKNTTDGSADYSKRDNLYVRHNKIYLFEKTEEENYPSSTHYSGGGSGSARQFIALDFGETGIEEQSSGWQTVAPEGVYDMQGRRVATGEQAADGSWRKGMKSGVYIENGRKVVVK